MEQILKNGPQGLPGLILIYGDDGGLVRKLAKDAATLVCPDDDPFMTDKFSAMDVKNTPSLLSESTQTMGFGGGRKLISVDANHLDSPTQTAMTDAVKTLLADTQNEADTSGAVVVITAAGLDAKQAMVKAAEKHPNAAAVRCFLDSGKDLNTVINEKLARTNQKIAPDARQFLVDGLGKDRGVTESELDKLTLYTKDEPEITLEHCLDIIAAAPSVNIFKLCDAIGLRDRAQTDSVLKQLHHEGVDPNMMIAMVARHMRRLKTCQGLCKEGLPPQQAMMKLRPPVFMGKEAFQTQLNRTPEIRVQQNLKHLYTLQEASRKGVSDPVLTIHRGLLAISA